LGQGWAARSAVDSADGVEDARARLALDGYAARPQEEEAVAAREFEVARYACQTLLVFGHLEDVRRNLLADGRNAHVQLVGGAQLDDIRLGLEHV
jgi:hypothetical protein